MLAAEAGLQPVMIGRKVRADRRYQEYYPLLGKLSEYQQHAVNPPSGRRSQTSQRTVEKSGGDTDSSEEDRGSLEWELDPAPLPGRLAMGSTPAMVRTALQQLRDGEGPPEEPSARPRFEGKRLKPPQIHTWLQIPKPERGWNPRVSYPWTLPEPVASGREEPRRVGDWLPNLPPMSRKVPRITNQVGTSLYNYTGQPWEVEAHGLIFIVDENYRPWNRRFDKQLSDNAKIEYQKEVRELMKAAKPPV